MVWSRFSDVRADRRQRAHPELVRARRPGAVSGRGPGAVRARSGHGPGAVRARCPGAVRARLSSGGGPATLAGSMRLALVLLLINGLTPAFGEIAEAVVHYAVEGHLAHTDADQGDLGEQGQEHGCGATEHHCSCCVSQVVMAPSARAVLPAVPAGTRAPVVRERLTSLHAPAPPYRPPIAS